MSCGTGPHNTPTNDKIRQERYARFVRSKSAFHRICTGDMDAVFFGIRIGGVGVGGKDEHNTVAWLVQQGVALVFEWCEPLVVKGHGGSSAEFLAWGLLAVEGIVNLSTTKASRRTTAKCEVSLRVFARCPGETGANEIGNGQ